MSYREENGQVVLTMSREDYVRLLFRLGAGFGAWLHSHSDRFPDIVRDELAFINRLNEGNPNYTPQKVADAHTDGGQGPGMLSPDKRNT